MKRILSFSFLVLGLALFFVSCNRDKLTVNNKLKADISLADQLELSMSLVQNGVSEIENTAAFKLLTVNELQNKSIDASTWSEYSILLDSIAGAYEFQPTAIDTNRNAWVKFSMFNKVGENDKLVTALPSELAFAPTRLQKASPLDTFGVNNFVITASQYQRTWLKAWDYTYKIDADIALNDTSLGVLKIDKVYDTEDYFHYNAGFDFVNGYSLTRNFTRTDTVKRSYTFSKDGEALLGETYVLDKWVKGERNNKRRQYYILSIGNIELRRDFSEDTVMVFVDGEIREDARATIIERSSFEEPSIFRNIDIEITFEDESKVLVSELAGAALEQLKLVHDNLHDLYFAKHVVDYMASNIYRERDFYRWVKP